MSKEKEVEDLRELLNRLTKVNINIYNHQLEKEKKLNQRIETLETRLSVLEDRCEQ